MRFQGKPVRKNERMYSRDTHEKGNIINSKGGRDFPTKFVRRKINPNRIEIEETSKSRITTDKKKLRFP